MASLNGFASSITGTTGSVHFLESKSGWRIFVCPRGIHASANGSASPIVADSADAASRISANQWFQVGTDVAKIRQCSAVGGNSFAYSGSAISVTAGDRIVVIGSTQPTVSGVSATYQPNTTTYDRDDDAATPITNSMFTSDSNGGFQFWAADNQYDAIVQDNNQVCQQVLEDIPILRTSGDLVPSTPYTTLLGNTNFPWGSFYYAGELISGITGAAGRTYHSFDTVSGWTQGNLFGFAINNVTKVYGDTHGGIFQSWSLPEVHNVKSARYGAKGDGITDDTTAITTAIAAATGAADGAGGVVFFPPGIYIINSALTITTRVRLLGSGDRISVIRAGSSFTFNGTTDALVVIGNGPDAYGTIEHLMLDCNNVANSICIYSADVQERGGPRDCVLSRYRNYGIYYASGCQNTTIERCDFFFSASSTTAIAIYEAVTAAKHFIRNCTFNSYDGVANSTNAAIYIDSGICSIYDCHFEHHKMGAQYVNTSNGIFANNQSTSGVSTLAVIGNGVMVLSPAAEAGTNVIGDNAAGITITSLNAGGWYMRSNDGTTKDLWTSNSATQNYHGAPTTFGTTASFAGTIIGASRQSLTTGTVLTLTAGNCFGLSTSPAGTTSITSITPTQDGRRVVFYGDLGTSTFTDGNNIKTAAGSVDITPNDIVEFVCVGTTWCQLAAKVAL